LEAPSGSDNFKIIEQRRNDIRLIQNIQERQEEAFVHLFTFTNHHSLTPSSSRKNLRQERLEDLCKKRPHISLKAGKIWKSVTHAIRRIEVCCPLFVGLDRTWSIAIFEGDVIGCSHKWWDFQYDYKEKEFRDVYEKPHAYIWYETVSSASPSAENRC
jgi:hypothetical protein